MNSTYLKAMSVPFIHVLRVSVKLAWNTEQMSAFQTQQHNAGIELRFLLRSTLLLDLNMVRLFPSLMVPPICPGLCSGMSITCKHSRGAIVMNTITTLQRSSLSSIYTNLPPGALILGQIQWSWRLRKEKCVRTVSVFVQLEQRNQLSERFISNIHFNTLIHKCSLYFYLKNPHNHVMAHIVLVTKYLIIE